MKIVATGIDATVITLGDDSVGDYIVDPPPMPSERRDVQVEGLAFGDRKFSKGRGNRATSFAWTVCRVHDSGTAACLFAWNHARLVPVDCSLLVDGPVCASYSRAVITEVAVVDITGTNTKIRYTVEGAVPA